MPIHCLAHELGPHVCNALIGVNMLTGRDANRALSGLGKAKGINMLCARQLGEETELSNHTLEACEVFICAVYTAVKVAGTKVNDVRYWMFCQKGQRNDNLSPMSDSLQLHMQRGNYQDFRLEESA